jgi:hypothetical protein
MPPRPGPKMDFLTIRNTDPVDYIVLSNQISAHDVHWIGSRTMPCTTGKSTCEFCTQNKPIRWRGYLHVIPYRETGKQLFLCLTPGVGWEMLNEIEPDYTFRGKILSVWRANKSAASAMLFRWKTDNHTTFRELPPALDPGPFLDTVFRKQKPLA